MSKEKVMDNNIAHCAHCCCQNIRWVSRMFILCLTCGEETISWWEDGRYLCFPYWREENE